MRRTGLRILSVNPPELESMGIRPGDRIIGVDGRRVEDELDLRFYWEEDQGMVEVELLRADRRWRLRFPSRHVSALVFEPMRPRRCRNRCIFCFVDQLPDGLRESLYVKDEDYRFSFLHGNYVTLASATDQDLERICRLRLQPLYVSVHATAPRVRNLLLGRARSRDLLETLAMLGRAGIKVHAQVVLCPGINDGRVLEKTILDLAELYPAVVSVAVVPVGLTRFRRQKGLCALTPVGAGHAAKTIQQIHKLRTFLKVKYNTFFVHLADEFYALANSPFPRAGQYEGFPQWENGVGMIPKFYEQWRARKGRGRRWRSKGSPGEFIVPTGRLAYPALRPYVEWLEGRSGLSIRLVPVDNLFLGKRVTVTGLIGGRDLIRGLRRYSGPRSVLLVPDVMLDRCDQRFLDDLSLDEVGRALSVPVQAFRPDPAGFELALKGFSQVFG